MSRTGVNLGGLNFRKSRRASATTIISIIVILSLFGYLVVRRSQAASSKLYLSPGIGTPATGELVKVGLRANIVGASPSETANVIQANLKYPADKLELVSVDYAGSVFDIQAQSAFGAGKIKIARGVIKGTVGDVLVANLVFKSKSTGAAPITFTDGSSLIRKSNNQNFLGAVDGANYKVVAQAATLPPAPITPTTTPTAPPPAPTEQTVALPDNPDPIAAPDPSDSEQSFDAQPLPELPDNVIESAGTYWWPSIQSGSVGSDSGQALVRDRTSNAVSTAAETFDIHTTYTGSPAANTVSNLKTLPKPSAGPIEAVQGWFDGVSQWLGHLLGIYHTN